MRTSTVARRRLAGPTILCILFLLAVGIAYAHDVWLTPDRFVLVRGDTLVVHQFAGTELESEHDLPLNRSLTRSFQLTTAQGSVDLLALLPDFRTQPEIKPVLQRKLDFEGQALVTMEHAFIWEEFTNDQFRANLEHEEFELDRFIPHMGQRSNQIERYARTLKLLIQVGEGGDGDLHRRAMGQKLEILLLQNPYLLEPGDDLEVQVLFEGRPLPDRLVKALSRNPSGVVSKARARTDATGVANFELEHAGAWLIRLVHMVPCAEHPNVDCDEVDWESYWTSYSFQLN